MQILWQQRPERGEPVLASRAKLLLPGSNFSLPTPVLFTRLCQKQTGAIPQGNPQPRTAVIRSEKHSGLMFFDVS